MSSLPPINVSLPTRTSVKFTSEVQAPSWPIFASFTPISTPGVFAGTRNTAMPGPSASAGRVRANTMNRSATGALVMYCLRPVITQSSPSATAFVFRPDGLEPAPGSVSAKEATTSPDAMGSSQRAF